MQLSERTLEILKNFSSINSALILHEGRVQKTRSRTGIIYAEALMAETFPSASIYNLPEFLGICQLMDQPNIEWHGDHAVIEDARNSATYWFAEESHLESMGLVKSNVVIKEKDICCTANIEDKQFVKLMRARGVVGASMVRFVKEGKDAYAEAYNPDSRLGNSYRVKLDDVSDPSKLPSVSISAESMIMLNQGYQLRFEESGRKLKFQGTDVFYWVSGEM